MDEIYRHARIARGWWIRVTYPVFRSLSIVPGTPRERVEEVLTAVHHAQAIVDARHAVN